MVSHPGTSVPDTSSAHFRLPGFAHARELRHGSLVLLAHESIGRLPCYRRIIDFLLLRLVINVTDDSTCRVTFDRRRPEMTLTKDIFVLENPAQCVCLCVCVSFPSLSNELTGQQTKKKKRKTAQVPDTFHQQPSIYTLRLLACHSISHSVDYTPRGASGRESHWKSNFVPHQMSGWILQMLRDNH